MFQTDDFYLRIQRFLIGESFGEDYHFQLPIFKNFVCLESLRMVGLGLFQEMRSWKRPLRHDLLFLRRSEGRLRNTICKRRIEVHCALLVWLFLSCQQKIRIWSCHSCKKLDFKSLSHVGPWVNMVKLSKMVTI